MEQLHGHSGIAIKHRSERRRERSNNTNSRTETDLWCEDIVIEESSISMDAYNVEHVYVIGESVRGNEEAILRKYAEVGHLIDIEHEVDISLTVQQNCSILINHLSKKGLDVNINEYTDQIRIGKYTSLGTLYVFDYDILMSCSQYFISSFIKKLETYTDLNSERLCIYDALFLDAELEDLELDDEIDDEQIAFFKKSEKIKENLQSFRIMKNLDTKCSKAEQKVLKSLDFICSELSDYMNFSCGHYSIADFFFILKEEDIGDQVRYVNDVINDYTYGAEIIYAKDGIIDFSMLFSELDNFVAEFESLKTKK